MGDQEFHLPIDEILKKVPLLMRGEVKKLLVQIDNLDLNGDGKRDLAQAAVLVLALAPFADKLNDAVDFEKLADFVVSQPFVKDQAVAREAIKAVGHALERV